MDDKENHDCLAEIWHLNFTHQNLALMNPSLHYSLFLLTSLPLQTRHRNCLRDPTLSKCQQASPASWKPCFTVHRDHVLTQTICYLQLPPPGCSIFCFHASMQLFSHSLLEPEVTHCLTGERFIVLSELVLWNRSLKMIENS